MNTTTQAWSTKMISLMDGEELYVQTIKNSLIYNGKMELNMDTIDIFLNLVAIINGNVKMAKKLEIFEMN